MQVRVDCEQNAAQGCQPVSVQLGERRFAVTAIIDRWPSENYEYIKVRADDDATYILKHDCMNDSWQITLMQTDAHAASLVAPNATSRRMDA